MEHYWHTLKCESWFNYADLYKRMVDRASDNSHFVEVGSWKGRSASCMGVEIINSNKKIRFDCVDTWIVPSYIMGYVNTRHNIDDDILPIFMETISPVKEVVNPVRSISWEAASLYENNSLDFVFIDACHDYDSVLKDVSAWYPKVKVGGIIAGHDYESENVVKAVNDYFQTVEKNIYNEVAGCWAVDK